MLRHCWLSQLKYRNWEPEKLRKNCVWKCQEHAKSKWLILDIETMVTGHIFEGEIRVYLLQKVALEINDPEHDTLGIDLWSQAGYWQWPSFFMYFYRKVFWGKCYKTYLNRLSGQRMWHNADTGILVHFPHVYAKHGTSKSQPVWIWLYKSHIRRVFHLEGNTYL